MNSIKFSHRYPKLGNSNFAQLISVFSIDLEDQTKEFLKYDTFIGKTGGLVKTDEYFQLPTPGKYILLIFVGDAGNVFTTLRRHTPEKYQYYKTLQGEKFQIIIQ